MSETEIPEIGLGTWQNTYSEECVESVEEALNMGYRHVDTAQAYDNEDLVGEGIRRADVDRDDVYLATKVWIDNLGAGDVVESLNRSLDRLGTEYVDLVYVHWPAGEYSPEDTLQAFDEAVELGLTDDVGVSNFPPWRVDEAREILENPVKANQVEMHPLLQQDEMLGFLRERGIDLVAYSPLARDDVETVSALSEIARKHGVSEYQVALSWLKEKEGVKPIPKASSIRHLRENLRAMELELEDDDLRKIESIPREQRLVDPDFSAEWGVV